MAAKLEITKLNQSKNSKQRLKNELNKGKTPILIGNIVKNETFDGGKVDLSSPEILIGEPKAAICELKLLIE